jgi:4-amino-4-deoxy-L-arabinose transferase-like glycosyltransferase
MDFDSFARGPRAYILLAVLAMALFLPGLTSLPVTDRDEARFAQATRQMLETGDYVNIRFQDQARQKKPVGIHWLQAASVRLAAGGNGEEIWAYRLPSAVGAAAAILALFALARPVLGAGPAFIGALILASALLTVVEAHIAKTDAVLLLCAVLAQGALLGLYSRDGPPGRGSAALAYLFWAALGAGILIKGPVVPFIAAITCAALAIADRRAGGAGRLWRKLRPISGAALALAIAAPWFIAITLEGGGFFTGAVTGDLLPKLLGGHESHGAPPGFYLALAPLSFWPGVILVPFGLIWGWRHRIEPGTRVCLAWLIPAWIAFELVPTKLAHYVLPLYPAAALLAGKAVVDGRDWLIAAMGRWLARLWLLVWGLAGLALAALLPVAAGYLTAAPAPAWAWAGSGAALLGVAAGTVAVLARKPLAVVGTAAPALALFTGLAFAASLPAMSQLWPSRAAQALIAAHRSAPQPPIAATGYREPSLVFALGTATRLTTPEDAAKHIAAEPEALALIERRMEARFREAARTLGVAVRGLGTVRGFNLSKGRNVTLTLYRVEPANP